jgi:hypothetical protein
MIKINFFFNFSKKEQKSAKIAKISLFGTFFTKIYKKSFFKNFQQKNIFLLF